MNTLVKNARFISFTIVTVSIVVLLLRCGPSPVSNETTDFGSLAIRFQVITPSLQKSTQAAKLSFDSLIVEISAPDIKTIHYSQNILTSAPVVIDTIKDIPSGKQRTVKVWTVDGLGTVIHKDTANMTDVEIKPKEINEIKFALLPAVGSLYLQIGGVPTKVDSVLAIYTESVTKKQWYASVKQKTNVILVLDKIPNKSTGTVNVFCITTAKDTIYKAESKLSFDVSSQNPVNLEFRSNPGTISLDLTIIEPGAILVNGRIDSELADSTETGEIIITEIMYDVDGSEYIELYNLLPSAVTYDSLYICINDESRLITDMTFAPNSFNVIPRDTLPWVDTIIKPMSFLQLTIDGSWIAIRAKDSTLIDRVIYTGRENSAGWPKAGDSASIALDSNAYTSKANNYGTSWKLSSSLIPNSTGQYGSPGRR